MLLSIPRIGSSPDWERYPKANAARSADTAQQIIGWKTFFTSDGNLKPTSRKKRLNVHTKNKELHQYKILE
jgi:hypothetical protein